MRRYQHSRQGTGYRPACKVCGAPRYAHCTHALCEVHYLAYRREHGNAYYHLKVIGK